MAQLQVTTDTLVAKGTPYHPGAGIASTRIRSSKGKLPSSLSMIGDALEDVAKGIDGLQQASNDTQKALRHNAPDVRQILVKDSTGRVVAALGDFTYSGSGVTTPNYFSEIHVGDPLNTGNPAQALFNAANGKVTIGQNGIVEILDPFGGDAAWIGAQADTLPVTGAVDNGSGLIRLTVTAHTLATGDIVPVMDVGGVPNATGLFTVTGIDANHVDLQNSVFIGLYTSGGTINRLLHLAGAANNGSGLIRLQTAVAHTYETGDEVNVLSVGGVPNATGQWVVTVLDATHFDLQGSTFAGAYTSGGTCLRYFAGMLAQTIAIGPSFPNYKLRAFPDGSLKIKNATFTLNSGAVTTTIANVPTSGVGVVGLEVQDNATLDAAVVVPDAMVLFTTDPSGAKVAASLAHNGAAGIVRAYDGTGAGGIDTHGAQCIMDGSNGNVQALGTVTSTGGFVFVSTAGLSTTRKTVNVVTTSGSAVFGTPGAGQSNGTVVTGVSVITSGFGGGLLTS